MIRNEVCVAFRGDCQKCVEVLDRLGYQFQQNNSEARPKDSIGEKLVITFAGGSYAILDTLPNVSLTQLDNVFRGREVPQDFSEFEKLVSKLEIIG